MTSFEWRPIRYRNVIAVLKNPYLPRCMTFGGPRVDATVAGELL